MSCFLGVVTPLTQSRIARAPPGVHPNGSSVSCPGDAGPSSGRLGEREDEVQQGNDLENDGLADILGEMSAGLVGESEMALE